MTAWATVHLHPALRVTLTSGTSFTALNWLFDHYLWKWPWINWLLKVPDLSGIWTCEGSKFDHQQNLQETWTGTLKVAQTWRSIGIALVTTKSKSQSQLAGIVHNETLGPTLSYEYRNEVEPGNPGMADHPGFCRLYLKKDDNGKHKMEGLYFNGPHRWTHGKMVLTKG